MAVCETLNYLILIVFDFGLSFARSVRLSKYKHRFQLHYAGMNRKSLLIVKGWHLTTYCFCFLTLRRLSSSYVEWASDNIIPRIYSNRIQVLSRISWGRILHRKNNFSFLEWRWQNENYSRRSINELSYPSRFRITSISAKHQVGVCEGRRRLSWIALTIQRCCEIIRTIEPIKNP